MVLNWRVVDMSNNKNKSQQVLSNLETIEYKNLSDITTDMIRKEIVVGRISSGTRVTERNISDNLGVSRMVAREAMIGLAKEGLLIKERNKYTKIVEFSKKAISDIFDLRIAIEVAAANKCLELGLDIFQILKIKSKAIDRLADEKKLNGIENLVRNDIDFHELIIRSSGNQKLIDVWGGLSSQILVLLYKYVINKKGKANEPKLSHNHDEIVEAFMKKDKQNMQNVIAKHITITKVFLLDNY